MNIIGFAIIVLLLAAMIAGTFTTILDSKRK